MRRVFDRTYYGLRAKHPKAIMIREIPGGFEAYVFEEQARSTQDNRYTQYNFMDKG